MVNPKPAAKSLTSHPESEDWFTKRAGLNPEELAALDGDDIDQAEADEQDKLDRERELTDEEKEEEKKPADALLLALESLVEKPPVEEEAAEEAEAENGGGFLGGVGKVIEKGANLVVRGALRVVAPVAVTLGGLTTIAALSNGALLNITNDRKSRHIAYSFGSKDDASGGIDCSGHTASAVLASMEEVNRRAREKTGQDVYDMNRMRRLLDTGAAYQINNVARETHSGFVIDPHDPQSLKAGMDAIKPGMLLGVERYRVPDFAKGRPFNISHIGVVVEKNGQLFVSESCSSGVTLTPLKKWLTYGSVRRIYAVNPLAMTKPGSEHTIKVAFNDAPHPSPQPPNLHPIEDA